MTNEIEIITTEKELFVKFPFELKDDFKKNFKTSKWDWDRKVWVVKNSKVTSNKLSRWAESVSDIEIVPQDRFGESWIYRQEKGGCRRCNGSIKIGHKVRKNYTYDSRLEHLSCSDLEQHNVYGQPFDAKTEHTQAPCLNCKNEIKAGMEICENKTFKKFVHFDCDEAKDYMPTESFGTLWEATKPATCQKCHGHISPGQYIRYRYFPGEDRRLEHVDCEGIKKETENLFGFAGGSGKGIEEWPKDYVIHQDDLRLHSEKDKETYPEFLCVVSIQSEYYSQDGWSFGVGDEQGYVYHFFFREATEIEALPLKKEREERTEKRAKRQEREKIIKQIENEGEYPAESSILLDGGEYLSDLMNGYGGGDCFYVNENYIWHVRNNGMDGDAWGHNNIRTGGAGAIGKRIPFDTEIFEKLKSIDFFIKK